MAEIQSRNSLERASPAQPKPKLPVPRIRPPQEKLASVAFVPVDEFFVSGVDLQKPSTEIEKIQQRLKSTDDMGRVVCNRIRGAYDMETRRIASEAEVGEKMLAEHGIQSGVWTIDDDEENHILANMEAQPLPNFNYKKGWSDFELMDGAPKPNNYAALINEVLLENILEGDSNVLGFKTVHLRQVKEPDEKALLYAKAREDVERQVQQGHIQPSAGGTIGAPPSI